MNPVRFQHPLKYYGKLYSGAANVTPFLLVLKNGILVLSYGRPGVKVAFSKDGTAKAWTDTLNIVPPQSVFGMNDESSDWTEMVAISNDTFLLTYNIYEHRERPGDLPHNTVFVVPITAKLKPRDNILLKGRVTDDSGAPVVTRVYLFDDRGDLSGTAYTDQNGNYTMTVATAGSYFMYPFDYSFGYNTARLKLIDTTRYPKVDLIPVMLRPGLPGTTMDYVLRRR